MKASDPLQRCRIAAHAGAGPARGRWPHIHKAVSNCTMSRDTAAVVSQTFICRIPEKPRVVTGRPLGVWSLA